MMPRRIDAGQAAALAAVAMAVGAFAMGLLCAFMQPEPLPVHVTRLTVPAACWHAGCCDPLPVFSLEE